MNETHTALLLMNAGEAAADLAALTRWTVLPPGSWPTDSCDPIMCTPLGDDGEAVVLRARDAERLAQVLLALQQRARLRGRRARR